MERLTPRERFGLLVFDEIPDRCLIFPLITFHSCFVARFRPKNYYTNGKVLAKAQERAYEIYQPDFLSVFSETGLIAEALGSKFFYPEEDLPKLVRPLFSSVKKFSLRELNSQYDEGKGRFHLYFSAIESLYSSLGETVPILAYIPAPWTTLAYLFPTEELFTSILSLTPSELKKIKALLAEVTEYTINFMKSIINYSALPIIVDPLASASVISPTLYSQFALPYEKRLIEYLHLYDLDCILHICGNTEPYLPLLLETNTDLISLDKVDMRKAKEVLGKKFRLIGNYDTTKIWLSSPKEISRDVKKLILELKDNPKGFILATGCEIPYFTPKENIKAFIQTGKEVGHYENFGS